MKSELLLLFETRHVNLLSYYGEDILNQHFVNSLETQNYSLLLILAHFKIMPYYRIDARVIEIRIQYSVKQREKKEFVQY